MENSPKQENTPKSGNKRYYNRKKYYHKNRNREDRPLQNITKVNCKKVSILIPLLNEEESLRPLHTEIVKVLKSINCDYEIFFVDDGSTDRSLEIIKELAKTNTKVKYISFKKNYGKSAALHFGFKHVTGDSVITMDADLQDDPEEIPNLLLKLDEGYDMVSGWKKLRFDPFIKKYSSRFFNYVTGLMSGI
ncbi:MAG: glycosyltransferase family 2 protein, partial [Ignavibacteriaceae bacterium]|nr:glycosyltransferase family 2 protein [Ignavibacteriaceae bacterium]